jgi:hypothetical protein
LGPPRRYYRVTNAGRRALADFQREWSRFRDTVDSLVEGKAGHMTSIRDRLVDDNLKRCHRELGDVPRPCRRELADKIAGHIAEGCGSVRQPEGA